MSPLAHIPLPLRIRILYEDDDIVVVAKPPHLRTVPGNAEPQQQQQQPQYSASQAWKHVVCNYAKTLTQPQDEIDTFLCQISQVDNYANCLPHKWKPFQSFVKRNWSKYGAATFTAENNKNEDVTITLLPRIFQRLSKAQRRLLPKATTPEESVVGQLCLWYPMTTATAWHIVHRLDCATSGVLVVGRTSLAAAALCRAWRERYSVTKVYWAKVHRLPTTTVTTTEEEWQTIHDALKPSPNERLKWEISTDKDDAKECTTLWRRRQVADSDDYYLELKPITGRTHQLRVHCAAHFGGIVGDTLYGNENEDRQRLYLHAYQLSFPHPRTQEQVTFVQDPEW
ncbi:hypothetical protein FisN_10Lh284 [Fistulifera solaris]|uniref:Pseudouridine synthase RsuA/RluA-like domain-containing protein n=1 Tax=Fistulifera solaris TaxID=1519565 RepID=A0A1Z5KG29_FISSO|nr:hypothetical protein FisN_10Lh284 [Fistulifera solaris]|eukprot:GAX25085.1 hypothetical protein FisN_10Lh284 [Fistulifera solaris]